MSMLASLTSWLRPWQFLCRFLKVERRFSLLAFLWRSSGLEFSSFCRSFGFHGSPQALDVRNPAQEIELTCHQVAGCRSLSLAHA